MSDELELKPCPFCGSKNVEISEEKYMYTDEEYTVVICQECRSTGPHSITDRMARITWNGRGE